MLPSQGKGKAAQLLKFLKGKENRLSFDDQMQLVVDGRSIPDSNYIDLMRSLYTPQMKTFPAGLEPFLSTLNSLNVPHSLVSNKSLINRLTALRNPPHSTTATSSQSGKGFAKPPGKPLKLLRVYR